VSRVVIGLGGNAMTSPDGLAAPADQIAAVTRAAERIADVIAAGFEVLITHGNGPQVGNILVKNELSAHVVPPIPLDWCVATTQGTVGFILLGALEGALAGHGLVRPVAALVTRTLVDRDDPGFTRPTKPIGRYLTPAEAQVLVDHGQVWRDRGQRGWRRVVASPEPREVIDAGPIRALLEAGTVVIAAGGGGVPVVREPDGTLRGVEAVVDKDLTAALLARTVRAQILVIATDVDAVMVDWGTDRAAPLREVTAERLRRLAADGQFASGSMGPKVDAACRFVEAGGERAVIASLDRIADAVTGAAGTVVTAEER
jgi:carbamate kinase